MTKKSKVFYFGGKKRVKKDAGFKDVAETQLQEGAIQKANYKTDSIAGYYYFGGERKRSIFGFNPDISKEEAEAGITARRRFLRNVARSIKISQLERKALEEDEGLTDKEKLELIKLDREFDYFEIINVLENEQKPSEFQTEKTEKATGEEFKGKIKLGGKPSQAEKQLSAILRKHKNAVNWSEEEYKQKLAITRGKKSAEGFKVRKRKGLKETRGRKKGMVFDAKLMRYVTKEEKNEKNI